MAVWAALVCLGDELEDKATNRAKVASDTLEVIDWNSESDALGQASGPTAYAPFGPTNRARRPALAGPPPEALTFNVRASGQDGQTVTFTSGERHTITINVECDLRFLPGSYGCDGERFRSQQGRLQGTVRFWGVATDHGRNTFEFDITRTAEFVPSNAIESSFTPGTANYLYFITREQVWIPPGEAVAYAFEYVASLRVMRVWIALPSPFVYPADHEHYDFSASHTVAGTETAPSCLFGSVADTEGTALAAAQVVFGGVSRTTGAQGKFDYHNIPPANYQLTITKPGYVTLSRTETIPPFSILHRDYELGSVTLRILDANPQFLSQTLLPATTLDPLTLNALANASLDRSKAVADGATRLLVRCESTVPGKVSFSHTGPDGGGLSSVVASEPGSGPRHTTPINGKHFAFAVYRVPEGIPFKQANNPNPPPAPVVSFTTSFTPDSAPDQRLETQEDITLAPTPVLLVHGLWGKRADWTELASDLHHYSISRDLFVRNVDYSLYNADSFAQNTWIIPRESATLVVDLRSKGYAATRVDVVAHSMGGVLTRIASNLPDYRSRQNFRDGYVRRVITVDTPHHGAPSASFLLNYLGAFTDPTDLGYRMFFINWQKKFPYRGAVRDLDPYSFAGSLEGVGGAATAEMGIPAHTLFCEATVGGDVDGFWEVDVAASSRFGWRKDLLDQELLGRNPRLRLFSRAFQDERDRLGQAPLDKDTPYLELWETMFSGQRSDGTVAVDSQRGNSPRTTEHLGVSHVRAPHNPNVRARIMALLNEPVANNFALNGLAAVTPDDLNAQKGWYSRIPQTAARPVTLSRHPPGDPDFLFAQPEAGAHVVCGQAVPFALEGPATQQCSAAEVFLMSDGDVFDTLAFTNPPFRGVLACPSNVLGTAELFALGRSASGDFHFASVGLAAQSPAGVSLFSMTTDPAAVTLDGFGESEALRVTGEFSDRITRAISSVSTGTRYRLGNTSLATVDEAGRVTAAGQGETWIDVMNGSLSNRVALTISFRPPEILGIWPSRLAEVAPTNLPLSISGLRFGGASALQVLRSGQPAVGLSLSNMNVVSPSGFMTANLVVAENAEPGRYDIVVTTRGGQSDPSESNAARFTVDGPVTLEVSLGPSQTLGLRLKDTLERAFILEIADALGAWSPVTTNAAVGGVWGTNGIPLQTNGNRFYRARVLPWTPKSKP